MKFKILHYYGLQPPVPEAVSVGEPEEKETQMYEVEIPVKEDGILDFVEKHGNIILSPPSKTPCQGEWFIWVTDHIGRFNQK